MVHGSKPREMKLSIINKVVIHRYTTTSMLFTRQCSVPQQVELHAQSGAVEVICIGGKTGYDWGRVFFRITGGSAANPRHCPWPILICMLPCGCGLGKDIGSCIVVLAGILAEK